MITDIIFKNNPFVGNRELRDLQSGVTRITFEKEEILSESVYLEDFISEIRYHLKYIKGEVPGMRWQGYEEGPPPCSFYIGWDDLGYKICFEGGEPIEEILYQVIDTCPEPILTVEGPEKMVTIGDYWIDGLSEDDLIDLEGLAWPILPKIPGIRVFMASLLDKTFIPSYGDVKLDDLIAMDQKASKYIRTILPQLFNEVAKISEDWKVYTEARGKMYEMELDSMGTGFQYLLSVFPSIVKSLQIGGTFFDPAIFNTGLHFLLERRFPDIVRGIGTAMGLAEPFEWQHIISLTNQDLDDYISQEVSGLLSKSYI